MRVRILGCSGGIGAGLRTTALSIDGRLLIDAGTGVGDLSREDISAIRDVFLTHAHMDHIAGLPLFIDTALSAGLDEPVRVYGRAETLDALARHIFNDVIWPDFTRLPSPTRPALELVTVSPGDSIETGGYRLSAIDVSHSVPALAWSVEHDGRIFAFSGDTRRNRSLWPVLNAYPQLDVLVVEVSFPNRQRELAAVAGHYCPETMAADLALLEQDPRIWITAMKPGEETLIFDEVLAALPRRDVRCLRDGDVIQV